VKGGQRVKETVRIWSQDYTKVLLTTEDREAAKQFVIDSGENWLPIVIDYGTNWAQRWSGRVEVMEGKADVHRDIEYLQHMMQWPTVDLS
jgi:hypothetical protein